MIPTMTRGTISRDEGVEEILRPLGNNSYLTAAILLSLFLSALATGCGGKAPRAPAPPVRAELVRMGYSVQVGAFSDVRKAIRLVEALDRRSVTAYYFRDSSGLFKVRFGDFPTAEEAHTAADILAYAGVIGGFQVIRPEDYAVAKMRLYGISCLRKEIVTTAESFIGTGYQWGGQSPEEGFDCSGLAVAVYQLNGLNLPRTSREQYLAGAPVKRSRLDKGDLVFFAIKKDKRVSHVGLYAGQGRFIHAPGRGKPIRYDLLEHTYYSSRYVGGRTYL